MKLGSYCNWFHLFRIFLQISTNFGRSACTRKQWTSRRAALVQNRGRVRGCPAAAFPPAKFRTAAREDGNRSSRVGRPPCARKWHRNSAQGAGRRAGGGKRRRTVASRVPGGGSTQIEKGSGWGGGVRHDKAHRDLDSSRGRAKMGWR